MNRDGGLAGPRWLSRAANWMPAAALVVVALVQIQLAWVEGVLTPAKGGGFGMFSTVDKLKNRMFFAYGLDGEREVRFAVTRTRSFDRALETAMALPSEQNLAAIARLLAAQPGAADFPAIRIEVWKRSFDPESGEARRTKTRELLLKGSARAD